MDVARNLPAAELGGEDLRTADFDRNTLSQRQHTFSPNAESVYQVAGGVKSTEETDRVLRYAANKSSRDSLFRE